MLPRSASILVLLLASAALVGCVKEDVPPDGATSTPPTGGTGATPSTPPTGGTGSGTGAPPPQVEPVTDSGTIQGPFEDSWSITLPQVSPRALNVAFNLTGVQAGAPPTASVYLTFAGPDGAVLKTAVVGMGGSDRVAWAFTAQDLPTVGEYTLTATAQPPPGGTPLPGGLPSGGLGNYELAMTVEY